MYIGVIWEIIKRCISKGIYKAKQMWKNRGGVFSMIYPVVSAQKDRLTKQVWRIIWEFTWALMSMLFVWKSFSHRNSLSYHLKMHEDASLACDICSKSFSRKSLLNLHLRMHKGLKTFKCSQCEKCFNRGPHLNTHMDMHAGVRRFSCEQCDNFYFPLSQSSHLNAHKKVYA